MSFHVALLPPALLTVRVLNVSVTNNSIQTGGAGWGPDPPCPQSNHGIGMEDRYQIVLAMSPLSWGSLQFSGLTLENLSNQGIKSPKPYSCFFISRKYFFPVILGWQVVERNASGDRPD